MGNNRERSGKNTEMATDPRPWPKNAEWARLDTIASAMKAITLLEMAMPHITDLDAMRNLNHAMTEMQNIRVFMIMARIGELPGEEQR